MIHFSGCKINLGLHVVARRADGYHDIETVMFPVRGLYDAVEVIANDCGTVRFSASGLAVDCDAKDNLCVRAYELMRVRYGGGGVDIHLHKSVPFGAGLGGGSSDAVGVVMLLNKLWKLGLNDKQLESIAAELGSDTAFFVKNRPALAEGRGEILTPAEVFLKGYWLMLAKPDIYVSTADAYCGVTPATPTRQLTEILKTPPTQWRGALVNDFEPSVFKKFPQLAELKQCMYDCGAVYASMSGSGSSIYGIFEHEPEKKKNSKNIFLHVEPL